MADDCIFCKIAGGEIPSDIIYATDDVVAFRDIEPQAPVHVLIIPRRHIASVNALEAADANLVGRLHLAARAVADRENVAESGYRLVTNTGPDALQSVDHIHLHLIGGREMTWPPG
jgi:histidine triad (HIT) family protein